MKAAPGSHTSCVARRKFSDSEVSKLVAFGRAPSFRPRRPPQSHTMILCCCLVKRDGLLRATHVVARCSQRRGTDPSLTLRPSPAPLRAQYEPRDFHEHREPRPNDSEVLRSLRTAGSRRACPGRQWHLVSGPADPPAGSIHAPDAIESNHRSISSVQAGQAAGERAKHGHLRAGERGRLSQPEQAIDHRESQKLSGEELEHC